MGTAAHLWQIRMAAQLPVVAAFPITWPPRTPRHALLVLALQFLALLANPCLASLLRALALEGRRDLRLRHEPERDRVHAVPRVLRRELLTDEDMAEVTAAGRALDLDAIAVRVR